MVNNSDRIKKEIKNLAKQLALENDIDPDSLSDLTMQIVDLVDEHNRRRNPRINQAIENKITTIVRSKRAGEA